MPIVTVRHGWLTGVGHWVGVGSRVGGGVEVGPASGAILITLDWPQAAVNTSNNGRATHRSWSFRMAPFYTVLAKTCNIGIGWQTGQEQPMIRDTISAEAARPLYDRLGARYDWAERYESRAKALPPRTF
jgi:hypothetical protein